MNLAEFALRNYFDTLLVLFAFAIETILAGYIVLKVVHRFQWRQHAYEDAPRTHQSKTGTPTMGGLMFLAPLLTAYALLPRGDIVANALCFLIIACAAIGFFDDFMSIVRGKNMGLRARTKFLLTALVGIIFLMWISNSNLWLDYPHDTILNLHRAGVLSAPHWLWLALGVLAITGTIHAVNLTDGLDGLATGSVIPVFAVLFFISVPIFQDIPLGPHGHWSYSFYACPLLLLAMLGGCIGFLFYNRHPAKIFMGDTGSLALGAAISGAAILCGQMLLLIIIGGLFVAEALSVLIQVAYFKRTKKRIFRMSPLHHHFELGGWPETKVTTRFWIASLVCSLIGLAIVR